MGIINRIIAWFAIRKQRKQLKAIQGRDKFIYN